MMRQRSPACLCYMGRQAPHLTPVKKVWGAQLTTVFLRQGHHALDSKIVAAYRAALITIQRIRDRVGHVLPALPESEKDCRGG